MFIYRGEFYRKKKDRWSFKVLNSERGWENTSKRVTSALETKINNSEIIPFDYKANR